MLPDEFLLAILLRTDGEASLQGLQASDSAKAGSDQTVRESVHSRPTASRIPGADQCGLPWEVREGIVGLMPNDLTGGSADD
jgi:hypothetical protein